MKHNDLNSFLGDAIEEDVEIEENKFFNAKNENNEVIDIGKWFEIKVKAVTSVKIQDFNKKMLTEI